MESNKLFAETPPFKLFIRAALPGAIAMLASMLYDTADGILVGRYLGQESFGAVTIAIPLVILCFAVADLIGVGASAVIAVEHGKKNHHTANNIFTIAFIMLVATGVISGIFFFFCAPNVLALMGAQGKIAEQGTIYLRVWTLFLPVMCISYAVDNFLKICGKIRRSTSIAFISAILGTVLEYYFLGILGLSVEYAALGYCISITFSSLYGIWPFIGNKQILKFVKPHFNWTHIKEIFVNGFPIFMQNISSRIYSLLMNAALLSLGGDIAIASYGVLLYSVASSSRSFMDRLTPCSQPLVTTGAQRKKIECSLSRSTSSPQASLLASLPSVSRSSSRSSWSNSTCLKERKSCSTWPSLLCAFTLLSSFLAGLPCAPRALPLP